jgi:hypothetical protein
MGVGRKPTTSDGPVVSLEIDVRKLGSFNRMAKEGSNTVASHLGQMTDVETEMEITTINSVDVPDSETDVGDETRIGISAELVEPPHGHVLFLFNVASEKELARGMIGDMADSPPPEEGFSAWSARPSRRSATSGPPGSSTAGRTCWRPPSTCRRPRSPTGPEAA